MVRDPRDSRGRRRRYDEDARDDDYDDDDDELTDDEVRLGLKVVELSPKAQRSNDPRRQSDGVIFHEFHPDHPGGEALVVKGRRVKVYPTAKIQQALGEGRLVETSKPETPTPPQVADLLDQSRQQAAAAQAQAQAQLDARLGGESAAGATGTAETVDAAPSPAAQRAQNAQNARPPRR